MSLALTLLRAAPFIVSGAAKQLSSRCAAALIITSCASVSYDPTLPLIQEARRSRPPHQDEPRIGQSRWGGWVTRARDAASNSDTNASFRTESQSFLWRAIPNCSRRIICSLVKGRPVLSGRIAAEFPSRCVHDNAVGPVR